MPWDAATDEPQGVAPRAGGAARHAAIAVWVTAAVQAVLFGCCAVLFVAVGMLPEDMMRQELADEMTEQQVDQLVQSQAALRISALVLTLVMFLPALALLMTGFGVRRRSATAIRTARIILLLQAVVVAGGLVVYVFGGLTSGDLAAACLSVLLLGGTLGLIVWAIRALGAARIEATVRQGYDNEPWNEPMT